MAAATGVVLQLSAVASASAPRDHVEHTVSGIAGIVEDPALRAPDKSQERGDRIRVAIRQAFDFTRMGENALGRHWAELAPSQKDEFVALFEQLFERSYDRLVIRFLGERRTIYGTETTEKDRALVHTTLVGEGDDELPVDYRLTFDGRRWAIADVAVDGVSLATNFRSQFGKTIRSTSFDGLMDRIRAKVHETD